MLAYWEVACLHNQLHYATYAKRYCETALNIAERINDNKIALAARNLLESLSRS
jgi:predicted GIY-YIG superfamily endonuclease